MVSSGAKNGFNCVSCGTHRWKSRGVPFAKTRTPPDAQRAGSREPSCTGFRGGGWRAPLGKHNGRAKGSSRRSWKPSGALIDWTPPAGAGCPRSLAHPAAPLQRATVAGRGIASARSVLREMTVQQLAARQGRSQDLSQAAISWVLASPSLAAKQNLHPAPAEERLAALRASDGGGNEGF